MQTANLKEKYIKEVRPKLKDTLGLKNTYSVPAIEKIVVNTGFGKLSPDQKAMEQIASEIEKITGQKVIFTRARKAIASFKTRKGQIIGAKVTLRGEKMYHFLEKLIAIVLPRIRDFKGVDIKSFDKQGNYTLGFREINVFPEVEYTARAEKKIGLEIVICTTAKNDDDAKALLSEYGVPFKNLKSKRDKING
ncbi:MAG: 50S ribosomal protein L5 [Candidatus Woykebacteria bacterium RBG_13_40_15]|uniref:Large ribosomal subunit protein uL5 n=1 Tax=Candidatus Woykebacteria bacterium RBG_13_40_15 TaxID=1802593 RepID=A0A1G1W929_9BACT|nr:MAG: 50S ribosomal protein L5 [Candidatus Woykebacteria bacterium RBG_13_40_15]